MSQGDELLARLAERPFDRALRLVFADWLLDQGDPRGEVIALGAKGELSLTQRRRVQRLTEQHAAAWLGPLVTVADVSACRWEGGFLELFAVGAPPAPAWEAVAGDPRLATVRALQFSVLGEPRPAVAFLGHPVLRNVESLQLGAELLEAIGRQPLAFAPRRLALLSWGTFDRELRELAVAQSMKSASRLDLITSEFINRIVTTDVRTAVLGFRAALQHFDEIELVARYGVTEGAAAWLESGHESRAAELPRLTRWGTVFRDVRYTLTRVGQRFPRLELDLSGPDGSSVGLDVKVGDAASLLVLLKGLALTCVVIRLPPGARLKRQERDVLRTAVRRLGTVSTFQIEDTPALP
ncbi:MAG: TIGR02996 domain-containing protein [Myxococcales bacterium]|nr:TIGR02996 domain-containing protein [Myxococcales bacterium]